MRLMIEGLMGFVVIGFLGTAGPRLLEAPPLRVGEVLGLRASNGEHDFASGSETSRRRRSFSRAPSRFSFHADQPAHRRKRPAATELRARRGRIHQCRRRAAADSLCWPEPVRGSVRAIAPERRIHSFPAARSRGFLFSEAARKATGGAGEIMGIRSSDRCGVRRCVVAFLPFRNAGLDPHRRPRACPRDRALFCPAGPALSPVDWSHLPRARL